MITKFFVIAMVLGVMSNTDDVVVSSDNIPKGLQEIYKKSIKALDLVVEPWMDEITGGGHEAFQHDWVPFLTESEFEAGAGRASWRPGRRRSGLLASKSVIPCSIWYLAFLSHISMRLLTNYQLSDAKDQGGDGHLQEGHHEEGLQAVLIQY
jgi:hypothetical protein